MNKIYSQPSIPGMLTYFPKPEKDTEFPKCEKLRRLRLAAGLTQADLAIKVSLLGGNVGSIFISRFECGLGKPWKSARYWLAMALEVEEKDIFD